MLPFSYPTSADEWQNIGLGLTVVAFIVAFALASGNALLNWKINKTKREESRKKDEKIALEFKAKEVLIANAEKGAEEARAEAAKANEGLIKSREEIARLTAETEQAKLERAEADRQIAVAKADASNATQRTAEISLKVEEEARKRAEAERALLELQQHLAQRAFTVEEENQLIEVLKQSPIKARIALVFAGGNSEARTFGAQIWRILRKTGWNTDTTPGDSATSWDGLILTVDNPSKPSASALLLVNEFARYGFVLLLAPKAGITIVDGRDDSIELFNLLVGETPKMKRNR